MIVSDWVPSRAGTAPTFVMPSPIIPISTATAMEITTQMDATLLEIFSLLSSSIAINRSKICGIPKYPRPQASVDTMVIRP